MLRPKQWELFVVSTAIHLQQHVHALVEKRLISKRRRHLAWGWCIMSFSLWDLHVSRSNYILMVLLQLTQAEQMHSVFLGWMSKSETLQHKGANEDLLLEIHVYSISCITFEPRLSRPEDGPISYIFMKPINEFPPSRSSPIRLPNSCMLTNLGPSFKHLHYLTIPPSNPTHPSPTTHPLKPQPRSPQPGPPSATPSRTPTAPAPTSYSTDTPS